MITRAHHHGFTLLEMMVTLGVLSVGAASAIATLMQMNYDATLCRLKTGAGTVAQGQIDYLLSIQPYNPQQGQVPPQLAVGTQLTGSSTNPTVPIYTDPATGNVVVYGWIVTTVADTNQVINTVNLNLRTADVKVFYVFRGTTYSVEFNTMRTSDI